MAAIVIDIADAVVEKINGAMLSQVVTAERSYVPIHELRDLINLKVSVVPAELEGTLTDRSGRNMYDYIIHVGVQQSIGNGHLTNTQINAAADPLMLFSQEIADLFDGQAVSIGDAYSLVRQTRCIDVKNMPIFAPAHLDDLRVFTSLLSLTFRLGK